MATRATHAFPGNLLSSNSSTQVHQGHLVEALKFIFPDDQTQHVNVRKLLGLKYPTTGAYMELDVWIPKHKIAFEFQDPYHYVTVWYTKLSQDRIHQNDNTKRLLIQEKGITLINVPCWWDGKAESLMATIHFQRPDLFLPHYTYPIPLNPHLGCFPSTELPGVGELMLASFPLESKFKISTSSDNWWMGEKYDGIRFCWNPEQHAVYTRNGNEVSLPLTFGNNLPTVFCEGEFWFGRGLFSYTYMLLVGSPTAVYWDVLRMASFDFPSYGYQYKPFEERYKYLLDNIPSHHPFIIIVPRVLCRSDKQIDVATACIIGDRGEGVILRKCGSFYEHGRAPSLIKLKSSNSDREGLVVSIWDKKSVRLKLPNGITFSVPSSHIHIPTPAFGDVVTFAFERNSTSEVPVNAEIYRKRIDVSWNDVVHNHYYNNTPSEQKALGCTTKPQRFWSTENMRIFLENFARKRNMDPLVPHTWYNIPVEDILQSKSGRNVLRLGYVKTLRNLFPEVKFERTGFMHSAWYNIENRRKFFENYAMENGFDPQNPENWYSQSIEKITARKGAHRVMLYHERSVSKALQDLFPNIRFESNKFSWKKAFKIRRFFENYAKEYAFDPKNAENWYSQPRERILSKATPLGIQYPLALFDLFPNIGLQKSKFLPPNRTKENWHFQKKKILYTSKRVSDVINHELIDIYPKLSHLASGK